MQAVVSPEEVHGGGKGQVVGGRYVPRGNVLHCCAITNGFYARKWKGGGAFCLSDVRAFVCQSGHFSWGPSISGLLHHSQLRQP